MLHGDRVGFDEEGLEDFGQLSLEDLGFGELLLAHEGGELRDRTRQPVGGDGDDALATDFAKGDGEGVVAAEDEEFGVQLAHEAGSLVDLAASFLDADNIPVLLTQTDDGLDGDLNAATARDRVEHNRLGGAFREEREVSIQALLAGLVVIRSDEQESVGPGLVGPLGQVEGFRRRVGTRARHDRHATSGVFHGLLDDGDMLIVVEGRGLAGRTDGD